MRQNGIIEGEVTKGILIRYYVNQNMFESAIQIVTATPQPSPILVTIMIQNCIKFHKFEIIKELVPVVKKIDKDFVFYNLVIGGLLHRQDLLDFCADLLVECLENKHIINRQIYQQLLLNLQIRTTTHQQFKNQYESQILKIVKLLRSNNHLIDTFVYSQLSCLFAGEKTMTKRLENSCLWNRNTKV